MKRSRLVGDFVTIILSALIFALSYVMFVFPNDFAPAGMPGIATMVQHVFSINVGYLTLIINIPLTILVYILVDRQFALKSALFSVVISVFLLVFEHIDMSLFIYQTDNGTSAILGPLAGGVISGFCYAIVMRRNSSTGGIDLVAALVHHYHPEQDMIWLVFIFNTVVAALSYFVYGFKIEPVILCLMYCYVSSKVGDIMLKGLKAAVKFEIITDQPAELSQELLKELNHGVTELRAVGGYTRHDKTLLICVVNKRQIVAMQQVIEKFPGSFAYMTSVKETIGSFRRSEK